MSVTLRVTLRSVATNKPRIIQTMATLKSLSGYQDWSVGVWIASDATVAKFNRQYRGKRGVTDILSFSPHSLRAPEAFDDLRNADDDSSDLQDLGDIIIAGRYVRDTCLKDGLDLDRHYETLLCHGLVHLLGFDHETDDDFKIMASRESGLLESLRSHAGENLM